MSDNVSILPCHPVNFDICTYMGNIELKKRLATRQRESGNYELYDSVSDKVIMTSSFPLDNYLYRSSNDTETETKA